MKTRTYRNAVFLALLLLVAQVYAADSCMTLCADINRAAVRACNYPEKELAALTACLATARANFDACKSACGK